MGEWLPRFRRTVVPSSSVSYITSEITRPTTQLRIPGDFICNELMFNSWWQSLGRLWLRQRRHRRVSNCAFLTTLVLWLKSPLYEPQNYCDHRIFFARISQQKTPFCWMWSYLHKSAIIIIFLQKWTFGLRGICRKWEGAVGTGWSGLRIGTGGGHLWVR
jgi:hypothetical protein